MSKMVKELAGLCYQLNKLYIREKDKKTREEIGESFDRMTAVLDRAIRAQPDKNDIAYRISVRKIRRVVRDMERESERFRKLDVFLDGLRDLGEQLEDLLN